MWGLLPALQYQREPAAANAHESSASGSTQDDSKIAQAPSSDAGSFSLWGVAAALSDSVKKGTADLASSVRDTDWRAELNAFRQGVTDESQQLKVSTAAAVEQLPSRATQAGANLQMHLGGPEMQSRLAKAGVNIEKLARRLVISSTDLVEDVKEAILSELRAQGSADSAKHARIGAQASKYSQLESEIAAMQRNSATYCEEPAAGPAFDSWLKGFDLDAQTDEIKKITEDNAFMSELQTRIVPLIVSHEMFWTRYFYRLHLIKEEDKRRQAVTPSAATHQEEEEGWQEEAGGGAEKAAPASQSSAKAEAALHAAAAAAAVAGQDENASDETLQGHSRQASRTVTEADSDEHEVEESGRSNGEGSGSDAWSVISHPAHSTQHTTAKPAGLAEPHPSNNAGPDVPPSPASETPSEQAQASVEVPDVKIQDDQGPATPVVQAAASSSDGKAKAPAAVSVASQGSAKPAAPVKQEGSDDDLSDLSGSEADGPLSEAEEDWGTWE